MKWKKIKLIMETKNNTRRIILENNNKRSKIYEKTNNTETDYRYSTIIEYSLPENIDVIINKYEPLTELLQIIYPKAVIITRPKIKDIIKKNVIGELPFHLAEYCNTITIPEFKYTFDNNECDLWDIITALTNFSTYVVRNGAELKNTIKELEEIEKEYNKLSKWASLDSEVYFASLVHSLITLIKHFIFRS